MEPRKSPFTPQTYARAINSLQGRSAATSVFPGNSYIDIAAWMRQDRSIFEPVQSEEDGTLFAPKSAQPHDLVVVYNVGEKKWDVQHYSQEQHKDFFAAKCVPPLGSGQVVFIRGFISPRWMSVLGSKYSIDPEFFRRHMDFLSVGIERHTFSLPSVISSSNNIIRLCVSTLLDRDDFGGQNLRSQRLDNSAELATYKIRQLGSTRVRCGDSLVREYSTVCLRFSVIEQWISICTTRTDGGWAVIAWMDQGRPLKQSPPGPWQHHIDANAIPLPVLQHHPKMAFRTTKNRLEPDANKDLPQSTAVLPLQYDSLVALVDLARRGPQDPLSMCIPLFAHAAFSEVQFLNLMESRIQIQINHIAQEISDDTLGTLQYFTNILNRHTQQLKDSARALRKLVERSNQGFNSPIPETPTPNGAAPTGPGLETHRPAAETKAARSFGLSGSSGTFTANGLLEDYAHLHARCVDLSEMCTRGITLAMNKATIDESRKAIEQSEQVKKLTLLATLFIPLSFASSLFGMNIDMLGGPVSFWWFFVLCAPLILFAYVVYLWDLQALRRCLLWLWARGREVQLDRTIGTKEKDPGHIV
ncbi:hypothetical protein GQ53DRAFT_734410 [Thozetella sp. PMI_491]|nr:hypothetical protein GQ53DRAFT_734410 [Thozetella sp. PMI_491]